MNAVAIDTETSQGIGRSTAIRLTRDYASIVLAAWNAGALEEVADAVKAAVAEPLVCDLSKTESADSLVQATVDRFGSTKMEWRSIPSSPGPVLSGQRRSFLEMGAGAQHERRRSYQTISGENGDQSLRAPRRNRRLARIHSVARSEVDDRPSVHRDGGEMTGA